jgi:hypothetical protein
MNPHHNRKIPYHCRFTSANDQGLQGKVCVIAPPCESGMKKPKNDRHNVTSLTSTWYLNGASSRCTDSTSAQFLDTWLLTERVKRCIALPKHPYKKSNNRSVHVHHRVDDTYQESKLPTWPGLISVVSPFNQ